MLRGVLKFYSESRGYGFIRYTDPATVATNSVEEAYVHYSQIYELEEPTEGQAVLFDLRNGERGREAVNVQLAI